MALAEKMAYYYAIKTTIDKEQGNQTYLERKLNLGRICRFFLAKTLFIQHAHFS